MSTTKKKKTAREKRVLIASLIVAGAIVAGSTFAWFTSKDEVTNRLSASANYGVAIAEDFQSPEDWVPGQTINKDVSAVNTGNVDAFVRTWLDGQMKVITEDAENAIDATGTNPTAGFTEVTDQRMIDLGLTYAKENKYLKTLSTEQIENPLDKAAAAADEDTNAPARFSEVQSVQAGGELVYAPANAKYTWTLEQATTMPVYSGGAATDTNLAKDTVVGTGNSTAATKISAADTNYYGAIDASTFTPETTGLYIFRRNVKNAASGDTYEYSGYYFDATKNVYFALHYDAGANGKSDYVLPTSAVTETGNPAQPVTIADVTLFQASEKTIETGKTDADLIWAYDGATAGKEKFTVTYKGADAAAATADDIVIEIALANIGTASEEWTAITDVATNPTNATTFYYNNDVEAGDTTTKLVDSVALSKDTTQKAYLAFDFDLNVYLESVQVTIDENGKELCTSVNSWAASTGNTGAKPKGGDTAKTYNTTDANEIDVVDWGAVSAGP